MYSCGKLSTLYRSKDPMPNYPYHTALHLKTAVKPCMYVYDGTPSTPSTPYCCKPGFLLYAQPANAFYQQDLSQPINQSELRNRDSDSLGITMAYADFHTLHANLVSGSFGVTVQLLPLLAYHTHTHRLDGDLR